MNSSIHERYTAEESISTEPWPIDAELYQPFETEQILLAENASCLTVKTYLKMCDLSYTVKCFSNAEYMSPGGKMTKLPFVKVGAFIAAEFEPILNLVDSKERSLSHWLDLDLKADMRSYLSLVENIFTNAELYLSFIDQRNLNEVTYVRNGGVYPWPLNVYENWKKRKHILKQLAVYGWLDMTEEEVVGKVRKCCEMLSEKLTKTTYFFGEKPTELDAITFGHIFTLLTTKLPNNVLAETVGQFSRLHSFCRHIDETYFRKK